MVATLGQRGSVGRVVTAGLVVTALAVLAGCHGGGAPVGDGWRRAGAADLRDDGPVLQVMIAYWRHAALRVHTRAHGGLVWDPGGDMHKDVPEAGRRFDVLADPPISLADWIDYRVGFRGDRVNEVYEWRLTDAQATALRERLLGGCTREGDADGFRSNVTPGRCAVRLAGFLNDYAQSIDGVAVVTGRVTPRWLPNEVARQLWSRGPDRVLVTVDGETVVYVPAGHQ